MLCYTIYHNISLGGGGRTVNQVRLRAVPPAQALAPQRDPVRGFTMIIIIMFTMMIITTTTTTTTTSGNISSSSSSSSGAPQPKFPHREAAAADLAA